MKKLTRDDSVARHGDTRAPFPDGTDSGAASPVWESQPLRLPDTAATSTFS
jgi:hypothetical protein